MGRVDSHGVVTFNMDASKKSYLNRTDLTIPFLQKYPLMLLSTTHKARSPDLIGATKQSPTRESLKEDNDRQ